MMKIYTRQGLKNTVCKYIGKVWNWCVTYIKYFTFFENLRRLFYYSFERFLTTTFVSD